MQIFLHEIPINPGGYEDLAHSNLAATTIHDIRIYYITYQRYKYPFFSNKKGGEKCNSRGLVISTHSIITVIPSNYSELSLFCSFFRFGFFTQFLYVVCVSDLYMLTHLLVGKNLPRF